MSKTREIMAMVPVIPVVVLDRAEQAVPLAEALVRGGLPIIEITLRTEAGLDSIKNIAANVPNAVVGAGSVLTKVQAEAVKASGGQFIVSPGCTDHLAAAVKDTGLAFLPGAATASEVMRLRELGFTEQKFFPAALAGGPGMLKAISGPITDVIFCPTGGIGVRNAGEYLSLPNVACVGGSWVTPRNAIANGEWDKIESLAVNAARLHNETDH